MGLYNPDKVFEPEAMAVIRASEKRRYRQCPG